MEYLTPSPAKMGFSLQLIKVVFMETILKRPVRIWEQIATLVRFQGRTPPVRTMFSEVLVIVVQ